jgi:hypothetical protein
MPVATSIEQRTDRQGFFAQIKPSSAAEAARIGWAHETRSLKVPNDELESVQRSIKSARFDADPARSRHELAWPRKWQARLPSELQ